MKARALLVVGFLALSPVSYGYGGMFPWLVVAKGMKESSVPVVAPERAEPTEGLSSGAAAVGFGVTAVAPATTAMPCTDTNTVTVTDPALLNDPEFINTLDHTCGTPVVRLKTTER